MQPTHPNIDQCFRHLAAFVESLGWRDLEPHLHNGDGWEAVWYTSGNNEGLDSDLFLQLNESPCGTTNNFVGAVYALEHELWTGWHRFPFPDRNATFRDAIAATDAWLNRKWFTDSACRLSFIEMHPECTGFDWKRIREGPPPYDS